MENQIFKEEEVDRTEEIDSIAGVEEIETDKETETEKISKILQNLKNALKFNINEWTSLALDLIVAKLIMDYKFLVYVKYGDQIKGEKQNHYLVYDIGTLINQFLERRKNDLQKKEFKTKSIIDFNKSKVITYLTTLIDFASKNKEIKFNRTYLRNFSTIAERFSKEELNLSIPVYIYKEVVERIPLEMFQGNEKAQKKLQNEILKLREEISFTDRALRIAVALMREDIENRANYKFLKKIMPSITNISSKLGFQIGLEEAKKIIKL